ncbi:hypothetical protein BASA83_000317 [Batrachochytrium salamandrivorans]|nr:hypothetical protein BASA83_000317 [Batrachochytrium salamandrivorans]
MSTTPLTDDSNTLNMVLERLQRLELENSRLTQALAESQNNAAIPPPTHAYAPEPKVSLPDKFNGDRKALRTFINQLDLIFMLNPTCYHSGSLKVATAGTLLTGVAAAWFNPLLEHPDDNSATLNSWPTFKSLLMRTFLCN